MKRVRVDIQQLINESNQGRAMGLRCPKCGCPQLGMPGTGVRATRPTREGTIRRYRTCRNCQYHWATDER
jgi:hypothetical protein